MLRHANVAEHRAELLRETHKVQHGCAFAFQVGCHGNQRAYRDHAGATYARDQQVKRLGEINGCWVGQGAELVFRKRGQRGLFGFGLFGTFNGDKAGTETVNAREVFVAAVLVDLAFAAQRRFFGYKRTGSSIRPNSRHSLRRRGH